MVLKRQPVFVHARFCLRLCILVIVNVRDTETAVKRPWYNDTYQLFGNSHYYNNLRLEFN